MKKRPLTNNARFWSRSLQRKLPSIISWGAYLDTLVCVQEIALEDLEFYAVYDPNLVGVVLSMIMFKPIEYLFELTIVTISNRSR